MLLCLPPCLCARSIPWPPRGLVPRPSALGLLHGSVDVTAILHQLEPVILHDPPWDGHLTCPQAAVEDIAPAVHWRKNTRGGQLHLSQLPWRVTGLQQDGACRNGVTHCPGWAHRHQLYCAYTPVLRALCLLPTESKRDGKSKQAEGNPPAPQLARQDSGVFIYPASGCCNTDMAF